MPFEGIWMWGSRGRMKSNSAKIQILVLVVVCLLAFQNCSKVEFAATAPSLSGLGVCEGVSCDLTPLTPKPAVTTILLALGDEADDQLVVKGLSAQVIAETVVRYTSNKTNPKILLVLDSGNAGEDPEDTLYIRDNLLKRYNVTFLAEPTAGLSASDLVGYDIIWFNNPGHPMGVQASHDALLNFSGGVVLQGDDLARGNGFSMEDLTGLHFIDNGTSVTCGGQTFNIDNNAAGKYDVTLDWNKMPSATSEMIHFEYGNDIDLTESSRSDLEVLALAKANPLECTESRPAIVRYMK
jgi:hypothetical protein